MIHSLFSHLFPPTKPSVESEVRATRAHENGARYYLHLKQKQRDNRVCVPSIQSITNIESWANGRDNQYSFVFRNNTYRHCADKTMQRKNKQRRSTARRKQPSSHSTHNVDMITLPCTVFSRPIIQKPKPKGE